MHISLLTPQYNPIYGGISTHCSALAKGLLKRNHKVSVITRQVEGHPEIETNNELQIFRLHYIKIPLFHVYSHGISSKKLLDSIAPDITHAHSPLVYCPDNDLLSVLTIHTTLIMERKYCSNKTAYGLYVKTFFPILRAFEDVLLKNAEKVIAVSRNTAKILNTMYRVPLSKINVVWNGISEDWFNIGYKNRNKPTILFTGKLEHRKGLIYLLTAAEHVIKKIPRTKFLVVGTGVLSNQLIKECKKRGLLNNFHFLGRVNNSLLKKLYSSAMIYVSTSLYEDLPYNVLQAQCVGVPTIATNTGGIPEVINDFENGILVPTKASDILAEKIVELLENPSLRKKFSNTSTQFAKECLTTEVMTNKIIELYKTLCK